MTKDKKKKTQIAVYVDEEIRAMVKEIQSIDPRLYQSSNQVITLGIVELYNKLCRK